MSKDLINKGDADGYIYHLEFSKQGQKPVSGNLNWSCDHRLPQSPSSPITIDFRNNLIYPLKQQTNNQK